MCCNPANGRVDFEEWLAYKIQLHGIEWIVSLSANRDKKPKKKKKKKPLLYFSGSVWKEILPSLGPVLGGCPNPGQHNPNDHRGSHKGSQNFPGKIRKWNRNRKWNWTTWFDSEGSRCSFDYDKSTGTCKVDFRINCCLTFDLKISECSKIELYNVECRKITQDGDVNKL